MLGNYLQYLDDLKACEWQVQTNALPRQLPAIILERQHLLPEQYLNFLSSISFLANKSYTVWFLTIDDFDGTSDRAFRWNEFEIMSLEWASGYPARVAEIAEFWKWHLPIALSVKSGYAYLALSLESATLGTVVYGREPEFESTRIVADDFCTLLQDLSSEQMHRNISRLIDFQ